MTDEQEFEINAEFFAAIRNNMIALCQDDANYMPCDAENGHGYFKPLTGDESKSDLMTYMWNIFLSIWMDFANNQELNTWMEQESDIQDDMAAAFWHAQGWHELAEMAQEIMTIKLAEDLATPVPDFDPDC